MYNIDDCVLIRTTNVFPIGGVVETPIHGNAYSFDDSYYLGDILRNKFRSMGMELPNDYDVVYETKRSTVHFTINGLVANSIYGNFDYPYIILEPLKYHINEESLMALRVEDTYFCDDITLSSESVILVEQEKYNEIKNKIDPSDYNIKIYSGDRVEALENTLYELGYPYFRVNDHGYSEGLDDGTDANRMFNFIMQYASDNDISQDKHFYSEINIRDAFDREENHKELSKKHLLYVLDSGLVNDKLVEKIKEKIDDERAVKPFLEKMIDNIDLEILKKLTMEFNQMEIERLENSKKNVKYI